MDTIVFNAFLTGSVRNVIINTHVCIIDNATIHKTAQNLFILNTKFHGKYEFVAPYSPDLKPIELGFSNIKSYLRNHENEALCAPITWIDRAFRLYAVNGPRGYVGKYLEFLL